MTKFEMAELLGLKYDYTSKEGFGFVLNEQIKIVVQYWEASTLSEAQEIAAERVLATLGRMLTDKWGVYH